MYNFSDAWFLTTLISLKDWASITDVIMGGDIINHAIFTAEEVNHALSVLPYLEFVEINDDRKMHATEKAYSLCNKTYDRAGLFKKAEFILGKLNELPYHKSTKFVEYFTENDMKLAYNQYIGIFRAKNVLSIGRNAEKS